MVDNKLMTECLEACMECAETCSACADACLGEIDSEMLKRCIRLNQDCTDICEAATSILSRQTETDWAIFRGMLDLLFTACRLCADECDKHSRLHEHCRVCAEACRRCVTNCNLILRALPLAA